LSRNARNAGAFWDADTRGKGEAPDLSVYGTVTRETDIVRLRDRLEQAHLRRVVAPQPHMRVLDLGGGAGRLALALAPEVREVTLVDASAELLAVARREAERRGIRNLSISQGSALDDAPQGPFDLILVFGVAAHLTDDELDRLAARCARSLAPGGRVVLKEPVTTDGVARDDRRGETYRVRFRPREHYAAVFGRHLRPVYQRATCAHLIPWFVGGTEGAVGATRGGSLLDGPLGDALVRFDPLLQQVEETLRAHPTGERLLAPIPVLQDLYVFAPRPAADADHAPDLSVVVIAFNEQACLVPVVRELVAHLDAAAIDFEVVIVDDGSSDATPALADGLAADDARVRVRHQPNKGIGGALRTGFDAARGAYVTWVPADGQIGPDVVSDLYGRRHEAPMLTTVYRTRDDPWYRTAISQTLNTMIKLKTGQVAKSGGNYLFRRDAWLQHGPRDDDSMMISTAFRGNLRGAGETILEVEIDCRARVAGHSKVLNPKAIGRTFRALLAMRGG
jgi:2-polyprenyl-3-methyl-5-hydroxy-6-metoxy-1,4-benzoquinol methylase